MAQPPDSPLHKHMFAYSSVFHVSVRGTIILLVAKTKNQLVTLDSFYSVITHIQCISKFCQPTSSYIPESIHLSPSLLLPE